MVGLLSYLFIVALLLQKANGTVFSVKNNGKIGYYDSQLKWKTLDPSAKINAKYVNGNKNGIFYIKHKRYSLYRQEEMNGKFKSMKQEYISVVIHNKQFIYGLTQDGRIYQCSKPCNFDNKQSKWQKFDSLPPRIEIENDIPNRIAKPKFEGKLVQLASYANSPLFAIDEIGILWIYDNNNSQWQKITIKFSIKSIEISKNELIFVVSVKDSVIYQSSLDDVVKNKNNANTIVWTKIGIKGNDFDRVLMDNNGEIYGINYYQQFFQLNKELDEWEFVDENVKMIAAGYLPSFLTNTDTNDQRILKEL